MSLKPSFRWISRPISLVAVEEEEECLFAGLVQKIRFCLIAGRAAAKLSAASYTIQLDAQSHDRSYQQEDRTYSEMARLLLSENQGAVIWNGKERDEKIGSFLIQYQETDWEFLRRVASRKSRPLIPEVRLPSPKVYVGFLPSTKPSELRADRYHVRKRLAKVYSETDNIDDRGYCAANVIEIPGSYENYLLGETVEFMGRRLAVVGKTSFLENNQLLHTYRICEEEECLVERLENRKLPGAAVKGTVLEASLCENRLALDMDGEGERRDSWHVQPVYYAGGGKGYSGQPEEGDVQYLYFPSGREEDRYILGSVDAGEEQFAAIVSLEESDSIGETELPPTEQGDGITDDNMPGVTASNENSDSAQVGSTTKISGTLRESLPECKTWKTPGDRQLELGRRGIILSNAGKTRIKVMNFGINLECDGNLDIEAGGSFLAVSGQKLQLEAKQYLWVYSGESGLLIMPDQVQMSAPDLYLSSPLNTYEVVLDEESVEFILDEYEAAKMLVPPIIASDGSIIRREGYWDVLDDEALFDYFVNNVVDKDPNYTYHDEMHPLSTAYECWLDDIYGRTEMGKFWDYMETVDGIQDALDVVGIFLDWADAINLVIAICRRDKERALWSAVGVLPLAGSLIAEAGRGAAKAKKILLQTANAMAGAKTTLKELNLTIEVTSKMKHFENLLSEALEKLNTAVKRLPELIRIEPDYILLGDGTLACSGFSIKFVYKAEDISRDVSRTENVLEAGSNAIKGGSRTASDWENRIPELSKQAPVDIPSDATVKIQTKNGYDQITFKWSENGYNYEVRWHTRTPGAPAEQGNTWVVSRVTPGTPTGQVRAEHILVGDTWVPRYQWQDAINAYRNGTATAEQLQLLMDGHWSAP